MQRVSCIATVVFAFALLPSTAQSANLQPTNHEPNLQSINHELYAKVGFLGVGAGYAYGVNKSFTLRGDVSFTGRLNHNYTIDDVAYAGKLRNDQAMVYVDWFPLGNGFRLTAGLGFRNTEEKSRGMYTGTMQYKKESISFTSNDYVDVSIKYPNFAPYLGIGWGHNVGQRTKPGWGFFIDAGATFGRPSVSYTPSDSLLSKLNMVPQKNALAEINKRKVELEDRVDKWRIFPSLYIGISYAF